MKTNKIEGLDCFLPSIRRRVKHVNSGLIVTGGLIGVALKVGAYMYPIAGFLVVLKLMVDTCRKASEKQSFESDDED